MNRLQRIQKQLVSSTTSQRLQNFQDWRSQSTIDKEQMTKVFFGSNYAQFKKFIQLVKEYPEKYKHYHLTESNRQEMRKSSAQLMFFNKQRVGLDYYTLLNQPNLISMTTLGYNTYNQSFSVKNGVHLFLYTKSIYNLGTQKHKKFLEAASNYTDIGCFGLTQLLHGSNVRGILTQAHYDHNSKEFIINSPSKNAMKFWIGAAANVANMSVIWAQLFIDGKPYGVHAYLVPLRDRRTHKLLPGVLIGDCGPKNGHNLIDNGFMMFDNVRIPKDYQLDRISGVDQNGKFRTIIDNPDKRFGLQLAPLSAGRFLVSSSSSANALNAITIALRYVCVRRQFSDKPGAPENLLMHYPLTKRRLLPLFAETFIYHLGNIAMTQQWDKNAKNIFDPKNPIIQDLHGISAIMKPKSSWFANECIKQCRQMLGGHGFSSFSRLGALYSDNDINTTWQGDNTVLIQQTAKYALDAGQKMMKGKPINSQLLSFLPNAPSESDIIINQENISCPKFARKFLQFKIKSKLQELGMKLMELRQDKTKTSFDAWNECQVFLGKSVAMAVGDLFYFENAMKKLQQFTNENNKKVVLDIIMLWVLKIYRIDEYIDEVHHPMIEDMIQVYCNKLSKQVLGLLQAISQDDAVIGSPFADSNGKGFDKYIEMILNSKNVMKKPDYWKMIVNRGEQ